MIYLDNAATSWPKPEGVERAMGQAMLDLGFNPGRGIHKGAKDSAVRVMHTRQALARLFGITDPRRIVFTPNATTALNMALHGTLKPGDQVITSSLEHNAVWRPLKYLERQGVELAVVQCERDGSLDPDKIQQAVKPNTKLITTMHASNVLGTILPIREVGRIAHENGLMFLVDASQTAGVIPIDVEDMNIDMLAFPGHKGLFGPQGTGGLYVRESIHIEPLIQGGTGNDSELEFQPETFPDRLESGTLNAVGIAGLGTGLNYISTMGIENIYRHEIELCKCLVNNLEDKLKLLKIYGVRDWRQRVPVVSFNLGSHNSNEVGYLLDVVYQIGVRTGLHCATLAHKTIGTVDQGTIRVSPGVFNTESEIVDLVTALEEIEQELL